jgi:ADP-ribose pyrophosphatase
VRDTGGWETKSSQTHFADKHITVITEVVQSPGQSRPKAWTTVHRKAAVVIAAMTRGRRFVLIRQERIPIRSVIWETPAGQIDHPGEAGDKEIEATALRELLEETGYDLAPGGKLAPLGYYFSSPGFTDEHGYFFLAHPVEREPGNFTSEEESILECAEFTVDELQKMIARNEIRDANTLSIFAKLEANGLLGSDSGD